MKKVIRKTAIGIFLLGIVFLTNSCKDELEVQEVYPFTVTTMPVQSRIKYGETAEIRFQIHREGEFKETKYYIRYFQHDGAGKVWISNGTTFAPNDLYPLSNETFRVYYTSESYDQQRINIWIEDSHGQVEELSFSWQNEKEEIVDDDENEEDSE